MVKLLTGQPVNVKVSSCMGIELLNFEQPPAANACTVTSILTNLSSVSITQQLGIILKLIDRLCATR